VSGFCLLLAVAAAACVNLMADDFATTAGIILFIHPPSGISNFAITFVSLSWGF